MAWSLKGACAAASCSGAGRGAGAVGVWVPELAQPANASSRAAEVVSEKARRMDHILV